MSSASKPVVMYKMDYEEDEDRDKKSFVVTTGGTRDYMSVPYAY